MQGLSLWVEGADLVLASHVCLRLCLLLGLIPFVLTSYRVLSLLRHLVALLYPQACHKRLSSYTRLALSSSITLVHLLRCILSRCSSFLRWTQRGRGLHPIRLHRARACLSPKIATYTVFPLPPRVIDRGSPSLTRWRPRRSRCTPPQSTQGRRQVRRSRSLSNKHDQVVPSALRSDCPHDIIEEGGHVHVCLSANISLMFATCLEMVATVLPPSMISAAPPKKFPLRSSSIGAPSEALVKMAIIFLVPTSTSRKRR